MFSILLNNNELILPPQLLLDGAPGIGTASAASKQTRITISVSISNVTVSM